MKVQLDPAIRSDVFSRRGTSSFSQKVSSLFLDIDLYKEWHFLRNDCFINSTVHDFFNRLNFAMSLRILHLVIIEKRHDEPAINVRNLWSHARTKAVEGTFVARPRIIFLIKIRKFLGDQVGVKVTTRYRRGAKFDIYEVSFAELRG
ncbi:hypothetical protein PUN28_007281 [Cardiocondyla obscurior]|uniref:Uncharacterized protein n=1 Tax=Cardiocondyla obscurior TaxID=286306 RepID=A0AAW2G637_9HYME